MFHHFAFCNFAGQVVPYHHLRRITELGTRFKRDITVFFSQVCHFVTAATEAYSEFVGFFNKSRCLLIIEDFSKVWFLYGFCIWQSPKNPSFLAFPKVCLIKRTIHIFMKKFSPFPAVEVWPHPHHSKFENTDDDGWRHIVVCVVYKDIYNQALGR